MKFDPRKIWCRSDLRCNWDMRSSTVDHMKSATARVAKDSGDLPLARCPHLARLHFNNRLSARGDVLAAAAKETSTQNLQLSRKKHH
jgi:hypothetical protein